MHSGGSLNFTTTVLTGIMDDGSTRKGARPMSQDFLSLLSEESFHSFSDNWCTELGTIMETSFSAGNVEVLEHSISVLFSIIESFPDYDLSDLSMFRISHVLFQRATVNSPMQSRIVSGMVILSAKCGWFVTSLIEQTDFLNYALACLTQRVFEDEILCILVNGASESQSIRDKIIDKFPVISLANELRRTEKHAIHERISLLLVNLCHFPFPSYEQTKLMIRVLVNLIRKNVFLHSNILWALHYALTNSEVIGSDWIPDDLLSFEFVKRECNLVLWLILIVDLASAGDVSVLRSINLQEIYHLLTSDREDVVKAAVACIRALRSASESFQIDFGSISSVIADVPFLAKREIAKLVLESAENRSLLRDPSFQLCLMNVIDIRERELTPKLFHLIIDMASDDIFIHDLDLTDMDDSIDSFISPELASQVHALFMKTN